MANTGIDVECTSCEEVVEIHERIPGSFAGYTCHKCTVASLDKMYVGAGYWYRREIQGGQR